MIYSLESLRGIAALLVAIMHLCYIFQAYVTYTSYLYLMVDLFFCLSGFVLALNYIRNINNLNEFLSFNKKRILRVYPLHFFVLQLFLVIELFKYLLENKYNIIMNNHAFETNDVFGYLSNLFLVQVFFDKPSFNIPSWSISTEVFSYIIFSLIILFVKKKELIVILIITISGCYLMINTNSLDIITGLESVIRCLYSFFMGVGLYIFYNKINLKIFLLITIIAMILLPFNEIMISIIFCFLIYLLYERHLKGKTSFLERPVMIFLGAISYSIYMIHTFIFLFIYQFYRFILVPNISFSESMWFKNLLIVISLLLVIGVSYLTNRYIENKFRIKKGNKS